MRTDIAYEIVDLRQGEVQQLGSVAVLTQVLGGILIETNARVGLRVDLTDDDDKHSVLSDREEEGIIEFELPEGTLHLVRLGLANYNRSVYPTLHGNPGKFATDAEVNAHFYQAVRGLE